MVFAFFYGTFGEEKVFENNKNKLGEIMRTSIKSFLSLLLFSFIGLQAADSSWIGFDEGLAKGKTENKNIIVDFYTDWCHWCKVMDEKTFHEKNVAEKLKNRFVTVRINAEDEKQSATYKGQTFNNVQLTQAFGVTGYPSLAFLEPNGDIITVIPGYVPPETFIYILDYVDQKLYEKKMPFDEFLKKQQENKK
jgi:thioredoxin-related protein